MIRTDYIQPWLLYLMVVKDGKRGGEGKAWDLS
jgi:hypothetical protein